MMRENNLTHREIAGVEIRTFHNATRLAGHEPQNLDEFTYSIAFPVAAMIVRGKLGLEELRPESLRDPEILRVSRAITLIDDEELTARSIQKRWAEVTLLTRDGRRIRDAKRTPRGDADAPLSDAEISAKYHTFADPVLGHDVAERIATLPASFDRLDATEFAELTDLALRAPELA